jgi:hypothetical protein
VTAHGERHVGDRTDRVRRRRTTPSGGPPARRTRLRPSAGAQPATRRRSRVRTSRSGGSNPKALAQTRCLRPQRRVVGIEHQQAVARHGCATVSLASASPGRSSMPYSPK